MLISTRKILAIDDDVALSRRLVRSLEANHYHVDMVTDAASGLDLAKQDNYDLVLLGLSLPESESIDLCRRLRSEACESSILLMTAQQSTANRIISVEAGADDYVLKPINMDQLLRQMRSAIWQQQPQISPPLVWSEVCLNPGNCEITYRNQRLDLTYRECEILELLLRNPHRIFSLNTLIERLWSLETTSSSNLIRTQIESIQRKLKRVGGEGMIKTVYGLGYRLGSPHPQLPQTASVSARPKESTEERITLASIASEPETLGPLKAAWERHRPQYLELVTSLSEAIPGLQSQDTENLDENHTAFREGALQDRVLKDIAIKRAQAAVHTLKGTLGSFGLDQASQIASQIEVYLRLPPPLTPAQIDQLERQISSLKQSFDCFETKPFISSAAISESTSEPTDNLIDTTLSIQANSGQFNYLASNRLNSGFTTTPELGRRDWLIVDNDQLMIKGLLKQASIIGIHPQVAYSLDEAWRWLDQHIPAVVTVDPYCSGNWDEGLAFLAQLARKYPSLPILVVSEQDNLLARVGVVRSGGSTFLRKPVDTAQLLETVTDTVSKRTHVGRILILDDDPLMLLRLQNLLSPWGFHLTLLSDSAQFWRALEKNLPDLLILDLEMPEFSGLDLCQVIRSDPRTAQIPILFLSAHTAPEFIQRVFEVGADDYISKPVVGPELIGRVLNRLERLRLLRRLAEIDSLTGLSRRRQSEETLERLLGLSIRQSVPLCMALLDLDNFKQINDRYGHDVGDQVLKVFSEYLRKAFRGEDVVARWGGEEFVVGLYNVSKDQSMQRLNSLRESFSQHLFQAKLSASNRENLPPHFRVSLSGGVAAAPTDGKTVELLYRRADQALYCAKSAGRNQICAFSSDS